METKVAAIQFTKDEADSLVRLLDAAVKARGVEIASMAGYFAGKISGAFLQDMGPQTPNSEAEAKE